MLQTAIPTLAKHDGIPQQAHPHLYSGTRKAGELPSPAWLTTAASTEASRTMATVRPEGCRELTVELTCGWGIPRGSAG